MTSKSSEASLMSLTENFDGGQVFGFYDGTKEFLEAKGHDWSRFWMLRSTTGSYVYCGYQNQVGGASDKSIMYKAYSGNKKDINAPEFLATIGQYGMAHARLEFLPIENTYTYLQFSGLGRYILQSNASGTASCYNVSKSEKAPVAADRNFKWALEGNGSRKYLVNANGGYLTYNAENDAFTATANKSNAILFDVAVNTYYGSDNIVRYNLQTTDGSNLSLGVKNGRLQWVAPNSRYSLAYLSDSIKGADFPKLSNSLNKYWYNLDFYWRDQVVSNVLMDSTINGKLILSASQTHDRAAADAEWEIQEANEAGDVILVNRQGQYICQTDENAVYTLTTTKSEAAIMRPVESVHRGQVYANGHFVEQQWPDFWQLKNTANGYYLFIGDGGKMGGLSNDNVKRNYYVNEENNVKAGRYGYSFNRMQFAIQDSLLVDLSTLKGYLQFSGQGRTVLYHEDDTLMSVEAGTDSVPENPGYQWHLEIREADLLYLVNEDVDNGNKSYFRLTFDENGAPVFAMTDQRVNATLLKIAANSYYHAEGLTRYSLVLANDESKAIGVKNGHLALVNPNSRYAVIRWSQYIKGPLPPKYYSNETPERYNLPYYYHKIQNNSVDESTNYVQAKPEDSYLYANTNASDVDKPGLIWLVSEANELGDIILQSANGYYLMQNGSAENFQWTTDKAKAAVMRPVEYLDGKQGDFWTQYWQLKNTATGYFMFIGWGYKFGGQNNSIKENGMGTYGYVNNRMLFEENRLPEGYVLFSAFGAFPLSDNKGAEPTVHAEHSDLNDYGAIWELEPLGNSFYHLRSKNNFYLAYDEQTQKFRCDADAANAYPFFLGVSDYQHNDATRYEFCTTDGTQALSVTNSTETTDGVLKWGERNTRYSAIHIFSMIAGPTLPDINRKRSSLKIYAIYTASNTFGHYMLCDNTDLKNPNQEVNVGLVSLPDMDYTSSEDLLDLTGYTRDYWFIEKVKTPKADGTSSYVGDIYLRSYHGRYMTYDATTKRVTMTSDQSKAAIVRLVETDDHYDAWQLQFVKCGDVAIDTLNNMVTVVNENNNLYLTLGATNTDISGKSNYLCFSLADLYPNFYDEDGGAMRRLQFIDETGSPVLKKETDGVSGAGTSTEYDAQVQWKTIGTYDNFYVKNGDDTYLKYDEAQKAFVSTTNRDEATHFSVLPNTAKRSENILWTFCLLNADGTLPDNPQCIHRNADGSLDLVYYLGKNADGLEWYKDTSTGIFFDQRSTPRFSCSRHEYFHYIYFPKFNADRNTNYCLTGRDDNGELVVRGQIPARNYATSKGNDWKPEFLNMQLWGFCGTHEDFTIMTRDSTYLQWDKTSDDAEEEAKGHYYFGTTTDSTLAAHFTLDPDYVNYNQYFIRFKNQPGGREEVDGARVGWYLNHVYVASDNSIRLTLQADTASIRVEEWSVSASEDYNHFNIIHKRSWFVHEVQSATEPPMTGFIQDGEAEKGWDENPYVPGDKVQRANVYKVRHYVKDGTNIYLHLPTYMKKGSGTNPVPTDIRAYERFYHYESDQNINERRVVLKRRSRRSYANGTIMGAYLDANNYFGAFVGELVTFQMPPVTPDKYKYTVAIDASAYSDFVDYFGDSGIPFSSNFSKASGFVLPKNQDLIEPTLSMRCLYEIHNAREMADSLSKCIGDKWLEEHRIAFPKKKVGYKNCTVPFNLQLRDYWVYGTAKSAGRTTEDINSTLANVSSYDNLVFEVEGNAGISVWYDDNHTTSSAADQAKYKDQFPIDDAPYKWYDLSERRFLRFLYPKIGTDGKPVAGTFAGPQELGEALGDSAVIKVYIRANNGDATAKYQLAKFTLLFKNDTEPRAYTEVIGYADSDKQTYKSPRSPLALQQQLGNARALITFNPTTFKPFVTPPFGRSTIMKHTGALTAGVNSAPLPASTVISNSYGYPLEYDNTSYDFEPFDASVPSENRFGSYTVSKKARFNWDSGTSTNNVYYPVRKYYKEAYPDKNYDDANAAFLYLDASELPGTICSLRYDGTLCQGSRLFFSAWMSSPDKIGNVPANVILTVKGIKIDPATGAKVMEEELYSYCPGPIFEDARLQDGTTLHRATGETGIWQQIYFDFINNSPINFDYYELTVNNACTNTRGGDIFLDEVAMFARKPSVEVERTTPVCGQELTLAKLSIDYNGILNSIGLERNQKPSEGFPKMWYCMLDKQTYDRMIVPGHESEYTNSEIQSAFMKALVGRVNTSDKLEMAFRNVEFTTFYDQLKEFEYREVLSSDFDHGIVRRQTKDGIDYLIISDKMKGSNLRGNHDYYLVFVPRYGDDPITASIAAQQFQMGTECCIISPFRTTSSMTFIQDGAAGAENNDTIYVCANASVNITARLNGYDMNGNQVDVLPKFDWWLDYLAGVNFEDAYLDRQGNLVNMADISTNEDLTSLYQVLVNFRHHYPTAMSLDGITPKTDEDYPLTQAMINGLFILTKAVPATMDDNGIITNPGHGAYLHLFNDALNITLPENVGTGNKTITALPIQTQVSDTVIYCFDPHSLVLSVNGIAPQMYVGFRSMTYPDRLSEAGLRIGLDHFKMLQGSDYITPPTKLLRLPLRSIKMQTESAIGLKEIEREGVKFAPIYLVGTNDTINIYTGVSELDFKVVGVVSDIEAPRDDSKDAYAHIFFLNSFKPREGYTYALRFGFEEEFKAGEKPADYTVCDGSLVFNLKIVPKYEVWTGDDGSTDWTNDDNWRRADRTELLFGNDHETDYLSNEANGTANAFAPLRHTSVVVPGVSGGIELYRVENPERDQTSLVRPRWHSHLTFHPTGNVRTATSDIEYDLVSDGMETVGNSYACLPYYTYACKDILLQPRGEILHTERLVYYDKFWMEYNLSAGRWYTLGSPFKRMLAGDWYAPTADGRQQTPYFADVNFSKAAYDRFSPAVYQRSWDKAKATLYYLTDTSNPTTSPVTTMNVAVKADWSTVYNDVQEIYGGSSAGGFSVKTNQLGTGTHQYADLLFRLPKEDATFDYYTRDDEGNYNHNNQKAERSDANGKPLTSRLMTDNLVANNTESTISQTLTNTVAGNAYFLVSNPFACGLDMDKFFEKNENTIESKYWLLTSGGQLSSMKDAVNRNWITVNENINGINGILPPGQGFFVKVKNASADGKMTVTFNADMMASASVNNSLLRSKRQTKAVELTELQTLRIRATRGTVSSEAVIVKRTSADNDFSAAEDLETLADETVTNAPMVYTLAGHQAATINCRKSMQRIPLGIISNTADSVALTFSGMNTFSEQLSLLDNTTGLVTPLTASDGQVTVEVPGNARGRYFILTSEKENAEDDFISDKPLIKVQGNQLTVSGSMKHLLSALRIVDAEGRTIYNMRPFTTSITITLPVGIYVIEAANDVEKSMAKVTMAER